jgi:hypothetical protein
MMRLLAAILFALVVLQFALIGAMFKTQDKLERSNDRMFRGLLSCMSTCQGE